MKASIISIGATGAYLVPVGLLYWLVSDEYAGILLLILAGVAMLALAAYLVGVTRGSGPGPEDDLVAEPGAGTIDGPVAVVRAPSASVWPLVVGLGLTVVAFGIPFTPWIWLPGLLLLGGSLIGYAREAA